MDARQGVVLYNYITGHTHSQYLTGETNPGVYTSGQTDTLLLGKSNTGHTHNYLPLSGTNYVIVSGNGTPTENATELQTAYNTVKNNPRYLGYDVNAYANLLNVDVYEGQTFGADDGYYRAIVNIPSGTPKGSIEVIESITKEIAESTRTTVIVAPGKYDLILLCNNSGIDIVSLTENQDVTINGINIIKTEIKLKGLNVGNNGVTFNLTNSGTIDIDNCKSTYFLISSDSSNTTVNYINCNGIFDCIDYFSPNRINHENCKGIFYESSVQAPVNCIRCESSTGHGFGNGSDGIVGNFYYCIGDAINLAENNGTIIYCIINGVAV